MKIGGKEVLPLAPLVVVIPRPGGEDLKIECKMVTDFQTFEALCPTPTPPKTLYKGEKEAPADFNHPEYLEAIKTYSIRRAYYIYIYSIKDSVEFDVVNPTDPTTWDKFDDEFRSVGIVGHYMNAIIEGINEINGLSQRAVDEAKERFLAAGRQG